MIKKIALLAFLFFFVICSFASTIKFKLANANSTANFYVDKNTDKLIKWALNDLAGDIKEISGKQVKITYVDKYQKNYEGVFIGTVDDGLMKSISPESKTALNGKWESFQIKQENKNLLVAGSDIRGTVYAIFKIAEEIGVSPWQWWADVKPLKQKKIDLILPDEGWQESPSVKFRGIFLNDEDFGLQPWAAKTFEPEVGDIGPRTYEKIFQLLLRLKANCIWPAMHKSTRSFFNVKGNHEMAEKYHIYVGTSHAEPMLRNNVDEWDEKKNGDFNYFTNKNKVQQYWKQRVEEAKSGYYIYTMGMRGIHDSGMEGGKNNQEKTAMLEQIIKDQRTLLSDVLHQPANKIPQVFIPYKEVLDLYNNGLEIPDDITLMWTDDNYGYIRHLSDEQEQKRNGGSGIYYHLSYWGRPHDYLWLSTTQPGLIWYEMSRAYQNGAKDIWIANVGDIKPAEYNIEFFMDLAWNINSIQKNTINAHLKNWAKREFGEQQAKETAEVMEEYYRLAMLRKPEFMGWSQTEPNTKTKASEFTRYNHNELQRRIDAYQALSEKVDGIKGHLNPEKSAAFFELVEYPVKASAMMNFKFLEYQKYLQSNNKNDLDKAKEAYEGIVSLTEKYNGLNNGKWNNMMQMNPRGLSAYEMPDFKLTDSTKTSSANLNVEPIAIQTNQFSKSTATGIFSWKTIEGLGYSDNTVTLFPFKNHKFDDQKPYLEYQFEIKKAGKYEIVIRCLPTHANNFDFKIGVQVDENPVKDFTINTRGRSEQWKTNVLRNSAQVNYIANFEKAGKKTLRIYVNHTGIVLDQIAIHPKAYPAYYEIPKS
ncbi:glycosyl hydrolase 115 family protein [Pedobacter sp. SD-b]|uniref:Glycosyl hydrolase 115 family protein n=1 Tax=Pedobacter segetis TaxID=2793069 RepID=A0ABS1BML5_9SPHI|nr:glycosyl hydrolase 115 family protein [Pedobacter segetis]MBK0384053.1 glycosyl hydrolase 115 family protein [Pedobacter segetis]